MTGLGDLSLADRLSTLELVLRAGRGGSPWVRAPSNANGR